MPRPQNRQGLGDRRARPLNPVPCRRVQVLDADMLLARIAEPNLRLSGPLHADPAVPNSTRPAYGRGQTHPASSPHSPPVRDTRGPAADSLGTGAPLLVRILA